MNLKKAGKRVLYLVGGIAIIFVASVILGTYISDGGSWFSQSAFYLYVGILFGLGLFIQSFLKNFGEAVPKENKTEMKPGDNGVNQSKQGK